MFLEAKSFETCLMLSQDLRFLRQTELGIYGEDDCEGVHPDTIQEYYGTTEDHVQRLAGQTGAGHPPEEVDDNYVEPALIENIVQDQDSDVRHDPIPTPDNEPPMSPELLMTFSDCLTALQSGDQGDLLRSITGGPFSWNPVEVMRVGHRRQGELMISFADGTQERRARLWLAAIHILGGLPL